MNRVCKTCRERLTSNAGGVCDECCRPAGPQEVSVSIMTAINSELEYQAKMTELVRGFMAGKLVVASVKQSDINVLDPAIEALSREWDRMQPGRYVVMVEDAEDEAWMHGFQHAITHLKELRDRGGSKR